MPVLSTILEFLAAGVYLVAMLVLMAAAPVVHEARRRQLTGDSSRAWRWLAAVFALFAAAQLLNFIAPIQDLFRGLLRDEGLYESRRTIQLTLMLLAGPGGLVVLVLASKHIATFRRNWGICVCTALIAVSGLSRVISLHAVDSLYVGLGLLRHALEPALGVVVILLASRRRGELVARLAGCSKEIQMMGDGMRR